MSDPRTEVRIERSRHRAYETVLADDLNSHQVTEDTLRGWHNRALHATYGVSFGLDVSTAQATTQRGAQRARVQPGLAYDATGRDLLVGEECLVPLPPDPRGMTLVLSADGATPAFTWTPTDGFRVATGVPLARTLERTLVKVVVFNSSLPPSLPKDKFSYVDKQLTILGLMTAEEFSTLYDAADAATKPVIRNAFSAWPFKAPLPSQARGLDVRIEPFDRKSPFQTPSAAPTLWQAVVSPGSATSPRGNFLTLSKETAVPLDSGSDNRTLFLKSGEAVVLDSSTTDDGTGFILATLALPAGASFTLDPDNPIDDALPVSPGGPTIKAAIDHLDLAKKIAYTKSSNLIDGNMNIIGFLTEEEANTIVQIVRNSWVAVANARERLKNDDPANQPIRVLPAIAESLRVPLFPPRSRPLARPRVASGTSLPGRTEWKLRNTAVDLGFASAGAEFQVYEATVVIESAGFTEPPQVMAWVEHTSDYRGASAFATLFRGGIVGTVGPKDPKDIKAAKSWRYAPIDTRTFVFRLWTDQASVTLSKLNEDNPILPLPATLQEWLRQNISVRWLAVQSDPEPDWKQWPLSGADPLRSWP